MVCPFIVDEFDVRRIEIIMDRLGSKDKVYGGA